MKLYRVMKVDSADGKPLVGTRGSMLGVRPTDPTATNPSTVADVKAVKDTDLVQPGRGLSTSPDPNFRTPRRGEAVFVIETDDLGPGVKSHQDHPGHVTIGPASETTLGDYQRALAGTRDSWKRA